MDRRHFIKAAAAAGTSFVLPGCGRTAGWYANETKTQPNIVFFLVDDMGWQDTSEPFHTEITPLNKRYSTPNIEALADEGVKFTQAYASAVCSPT